MKYKYITIDLRKLKGIKKAEEMKKNGWDIINVGFNTIQLQKKRG